MVVTIVTIDVVGPVFAVVVPMVAVSNALAAKRAAARVRKKSMLPAVGKPCKEQPLSVSK
jgi:hypothetical protein